MRERIFSAGDPPPCPAMGEEKAPGAIQRDEPARPRNKGSGLSVSIVNLDVLMRTKEEMSRIYYL